MNRKALAVAYVFMVLVQTWAQLLPPSRPIGPTYDVDFSLDVAGVRRLSTQHVQEVVMDSAMRDLELNFESGAKVMIHQDPPVWYYPMTELTRVPKWAHLHGALVALTDNVDLFMKQIDKLDARLQEIRGEVIVQGSNRRLLFLGALVGAAAMIYTAVEVRNLNNRIDTLQANQVNMASELKIFKNSVVEFMLNTTQWEIRQKELNEGYDRQIVNLWNTTHEHMQLIQQNAESIVNITNFIGLLQDSTNSRFANMSANLLYMQGDINNRFTETTDWAKQLFLEVYQRMQEQNDNTVAFINYVIGLVEKLRRSLYSLQGAVYSLQTEAQLRRLIAHGMSQEMGQIDPNTEFPLVSDDFEIASWAPGHYRTLVEKFLVGFVQEGQGTETGKKVAVRYDLEFFMDTDFAIQTARPYDTAENLLWNMVQLNCTRGAVADASGNVINGAANVTGTCNMWVDIRRRECTLPNLEAYSTWTFDKPTDGVGRGEMPAQCEGGMRTIPDAASPADFVFSVEQWRDFYKREICRAPLAASTPSYMLVMHQLNRMVVVPQNLTTCNMPYDQLLNLPVNSVERYIYNDLDFIAPYLTTQLSIDSEHLFGRAPSLGVKPLDQVIQNIYREQKTDSVSTADNTKMRMMVWNVVSKEYERLWHYEQAVPTAMHAQTTVTDTYTPPGSDYPITSELVSSVLDVDSDVIASLPQSGTFVGDLFDNTEYSYDAPEEFLGTGSDWRGRKGITALMFDKSIQTVPGIEEVLRMNKVYDPINVVSLDSTKVQLGRIEFGPDAGFPYCRVAGGVPENVTDVIETAAPGQVVPNGKWCSLMRHFNVRMAVGPGGTHVLELSPKQWKVKLTLQVPSGKFVTNLGTGQCLQASLRKISDTQVGIAFSNSDPFHRVMQRVLAVSNVSASCTVNTQFTVEKLGSYTQVLPACDHLHVLVQYPESLSPLTWKDCVTFDPGDLSAIIQSTVTIPPDVQYVVERGMDATMIQLLASIKMQIASAQSQAIFIGASVDLQNRIAKLANDTANYHYQSGNWTQLLPTQDNLADVFKQLHDQAIAAKAAADEAAKRQAEAEARAQADHERFLILDAEQQKLINAQLRVAYFLANQTDWFHVYLTSADDDPFSQFACAVGNAAKSLADKLADVMKDIPGLGGFFGEIFNGIGSLMGFLAIGAIIALIIWFACCRPGAGGSGPVVVNSAQPASRGRRYRSRGRSHPPPRRSHSRDEAEIELIPDL